MLTGYSKDLRHESGGLRPDRLLNTNAKAFYNAIQAQAHGPDFVLQSRIDRAPAEQFPAQLVPEALAARVIRLGPELKNA